MPMRTIGAEGVSRRAIIIGGWTGGLALATVALAPVDALATPEAAAKLLADFAPGTPKDGKVTIKMPEIAENGNTVPITIEVASPMTEADYVKAIQVVTEHNPAPGVIRLEMTPALGRAYIQFRMRMAKTERVIVEALMSDGSVWRGMREVKVTIGGCGG